MLAIPLQTTTTDNAVDPLSSVSQGRTWRGGRFWHKIPPKSIPKSIWSAVVVGEHGRGGAAAAGGSKRTPRRVESAESVETHVLCALSLFRSRLCACAAGPVLVLHCGLRALLQRACAPAGITHKRGTEGRPFVRTQFGEWRRFEQRRAGWPPRVQHHRRQARHSCPVQAVARSEHELVAPLLLLRSELLQPAHTGS